MVSLLWYLKSNPLTRTQTQGPRTYRCQCQTPDPQEQELPNRMRRSSYHQHKTLNTNLWSIAPSPMAHIAYDAPRGWMQPVKLEVVK